MIELARRADLDVHTVLRVFRGKNQPLHSTYLSMLNAIEAEERALLSHLLLLHPVETSLPAGASAGPARASPCNPRLAVPEVAA